MAKRVKVAAMAAFLILAAYLASSPGPAQSAAGGQSPAQAKPERFDCLVREDFFAGVEGDREAMKRAMKICEEALIRNPKHAEAMVWHGCGLAFMAGERFRAGDFQNGAEMWQRGRKEVDAAVELEPENVGVLLPRGAFLIEASNRDMPPEFGARDMLEKGLSDYEKVYAIQKDYFSKLSTHSRGELLIALAEGWHRMGSAQKARGYYKIMLKDLAGSSYADAAKTWMEKGTITQNRKCTGCHAR